MVGWIVEWVGDRMGREGREGGFVMRSNDEK
jgi:hypothetical protein